MVLRSRMHSLVIKAELAFEDILVMPGQEFSGLVVLGVDIRSAILILLIKGEIDEDD